MMVVLLGCMPLAAHASSFAFVLYPAGVLTAAIIVCGIAAIWRMGWHCLGAVGLILLTGVAIFFTPAPFYASDAWQKMESIAGEWRFFLFGALPALLVGVLFLAWRRHAHRSGLTASSERG